MNFEAAIKTIDTDYCNLFFAKYMQGEWGIEVGYNTVNPYLGVLRKELADWQLANDCTGYLCQLSREQPVIVREYATLNDSGKCVLNPPLRACRHPYGPYNVRELIINSFYR